MRMKVDPHRKGSSLAYIGKSETGLFIWVGLDESITVLLCGRRAARIIKREPGLVVELLF